jgi:hypothetical protein
MIEVAIGLLLGGAVFRLRGWRGFEQITGRGAFTARLVWATCMGLLAFASWAGPVQAATVGVGMFLGCLAPWWRSLSLASSEKDGPLLGQVVRHTARGILWPAPAAVLLVAVSWALELVVAWFPALGGAWVPSLDAAWGPALLLLASGLACTPAYFAGKWLRRRFPARAPGHTESGEVLFGAAMGAATAAGSLLCPMETPA